MRPVDVLYLVEHTSREMDVACAVKALAEHRHGLNVEIRNIYLHAQQSLRELEPAVVAHPFFYYATGALAVEDYIARWPDALHFNIAWEQLHYKAHWQVKRPSDEFARTQVIHHAWGRFYHDYLTSFGVPEDNIRLNGQPAYQLYLDPYRRHYRTRESLAEVYGLDPAKAWIFVPENYRWAFIGGKAKLFSRLGGDLQEIDALRDFSRQALRLLLSCCNALAQEPGVEVIFRTRPAVNSEIMLDFFGKHVGSSAPRLHFIKEGSVREWILASDKVVSSYSTSLIEAAVAGKDVFMFEPTPFPSALHCAWYDLAPKIKDAAQFTERCLGAAGQAGDTPLHRWANAELLSTGDAISNLCDLLQEMKGLAQDRRASPSSTGARPPGPLPPAGRAYFNAQTHEADVFEPEDAARWVEAWRRTLAGGAASRPEREPVLNRALRPAALRDPEWEGLAAGFPALLRFRQGRATGVAEETRAAKGLWERLLGGLSTVLTTQTQQHRQEQELLAACALLAGLLPRLRPGMRVLHLGGGGGLLRAQLQALGVEVVALSFKECSALAERPEAAVPERFDHAFASGGLDALDVTVKRRVLTSLAKRLADGGVLGLCFPFGGEAGAAQSGPKNQLRNVADIRRQFLSCAEYDLLGNEAFVGHSFGGEPCLGVVFLRRKGPQGAGE